MDLREILGYNIIMADLRVLIVAANPLARSGLAVLVAGITGMKIVGATGVAEAASLAGQLLPDTVLLDAGDGEAEDLDAIARLATAQPGLPIVALASEHGAVSQALRSEERRVGKECRSGWGGVDSDKNGGALRGEH